MKTGRHTRSYYVINGITLYRVIAAPFLLWILLEGNYPLFRWMLLLSFFTDFIDGFLARYFKVTSVMGTRLDSLGDDLTVLVAMIGLIIIYPEFIQAHLWYFVALFVIFLVQVGFSLYRYRKLTSFHTYLAKLAALVQGVFMLLSFFLEKPILLLFYAAMVITFLELVEEIILVGIIPKWRANVKGLFWVMKRRASAAFRKKLSNNPRN